MLRLYSKMSVKQKIVLPILSAVLLFGSIYTLVWVNKLEEKLQQKFETEIALASAFIAPALAGAVWDFDQQAAETALDGLTQIGDFQFAQIISDGQVFAELQPDIEWNAEWDAIIQEFDPQLLEAQRDTFGSMVIHATPIIQGNGNFVGLFILGFTTDAINAEISAAYVEASVLGAIAICLLGLSIWQTIRYFMRPLEVVIGFLDRLSLGETNFDIPMAKRFDEYGRLGQAVDDFRNARIESERLGAENAEQQHDQKRIVDALAVELKALSKGALNCRLAADLPNSYEILCTDFNNSINTLQSTISGISHNGAEIDLNSAELSSAAEDLATRTEKTAATLAETAEALSQLKTAAGESAKGAQKADQIVDQIRERSEHTGSVVRDAVKTMAEIKSSSDQIAEVISVIEDVSFQINLLALNASVEASRAGEAGQGFAVVATEVRNLSQRTAEAAQNVTEIIQVSSEKVQQGVHSVSDAETALESIQASIQDVSGFLSNVSSTSLDQSDGISEINLSISNLDSATQQNAALAEETLATSQFLRNETRELTNSLSKFQLDEKAIDDLIAEDVPSSPVLKTG
ncbi:methyl-accepting chemotaxis protein [Aestuariibius sp. HNIBRBA575]|uniref:methyl-accepting chemotaxis protein n=1 Tax=Aestuariibius sp. HNIBRBA575 TaxID=3233343 RepID=UPI0034A45629